MRFKWTEWGYLCSPLYYIAVEIGLAHVFACFVSFFGRIITGRDGLGYHPKKLSTLANKFLKISRIRENEFFIRRIPTFFRTKWSFDGNFFRQFTYRQRPS